MNKFVDSDEKIDISVLKIGEEVARKQEAGLVRLRDERDDHKVRDSLAALRSACENGENVMPFLIECAHADVTLGEMVREMERVYGIYVETPHL